MASRHTHTGVATRKKTLVWKSRRDQKCQQKYNSRIINNGSNKLNLMRSSGNWKRSHRVSDRDREREAKVEDEGV